MKKIINKIFVKVRAIMVLVSILAIIPMQSAQASETDVVNTIISVYNSILGVYADMVYQFDSQIAISMANNQSIIDFNSNVADELRKSVDVETFNAFAGIQAQNKKDIVSASIKAGDDVDINYANTGIFGVADDLIRQAKDIESQKNNALFNVEYLIGVDVYKDSAAKNNAIAYLEQTKSIAPPPPVIRLGATFDVPIVNSSDPKQKTATVGQKTPLSAKELDTLRKDLQNDQEYRNYKKSYRTLVAVRNMFLDNLQYSYQARLPQSNGKSLEQTRNEQVESRLTSEYYQNMSNATPGMVNREILFVLSEINNQLNEMRRQNERLIIMESVNSLNQIAQSSAVLTNTSQKIGLLIYCKVPANQNDSLCLTQSSGTSSQNQTDLLTPSTTSAT
jgi:hypothetical protein